LPGKHSPFEESSNEKPSRPYSSDRG
jgi:hypothetical protein